MDDFAKNQNAFHAFGERASNSVLFIETNNNERTSPGIGTGLLVQYHGRLYIVSALHVFDIGDGSDQAINEAQKSAIYRYKLNEPIKFRNLSELVNLNEVHLSPHTPTPLKENPLVNRKLDLIALRLSEGISPSNPNVALNLETSSCLKLEDGMSLITLGIPVAGGKKLPSGETVLAVYPDHVRYDPSVNTSNLSSAFNPENKFVFHYSLYDDGIDPNGFSGAPVWANRDSTSTIWHVNPCVAGIVIQVYPRSRLLMAVKAEFVISLLDTDPDTGQLTEAEQPGNLISP